MVLYYDIHLLQHLTAIVYVDSLRGRLVQKFLAIQGVPACALAKSAIMTDGLNVGAAISIV